MNEFEEFLVKKKPELRKMKDSDFASISVNLSEQMIKELNEATDLLSKKHQMDVMEIDSALMSYGIEAVEKLIQNKGTEYAKNLIEEISDASNKGDFKKVQKLLDQMRKDVNEDNYINEGENGEVLSFEQFVKLNEEKLTKKFDSLREEDFMVIKARNPEDADHLIELRLHKNQIEDMSIIASNIGMPIEEFAFMMMMQTLEKSENTSVEERQMIREFLRRQTKRLTDNAMQDLQDSLEGITLGQLKEKLIELYSFPRRKLDMMEKSWKKEFKEKKLSEQYRNEEIYVKIKFASILTSSF